MLLGADDMNTKTQFFYSTNAQVPGHFLKTYLL